MAQLWDALRSKAIYKTIKMIEHAQEYLEFQNTLLQKKPYFGSVMSAGQLSPERKQVMQRLLRKEILGRMAAAGPANCEKEPFRLLEVGSWAGCSCIVWCETARELNYPIIVYCVDPWEYYEQYLQLNEGSHYRSMDDALSADKIFSLFLHNVSVSGCRNNVRVLRGYSSEILSILRPQSFDFIYIDGNHSYSYAVSDIKNAKVLVKNDGIITGDDLEVLLGDIDGDFCRKEAEKDYVCCPQTKISYHPGVTLAIHEEFNDRVSIEHGVWAVKKGIGPEWC